MTSNITRFRRFAFLISLLFAILINTFSQTIVYPNGSNEELFAAKEVRRYLYLRTDQKLPVLGVTSLPTSGDVILVANESNAMVQSLSSQINQTITPGGIIIKSISDNGRTVLVITGSNSESTLIAAYRFAEHLGCGFDFSGDAIPDVKIPLSITGFDEAGVRRFETAGYLPYHDFLPGPDLFNTEDYMVLINQLAKCGMNFIGLHNYPEFGLQEEVAKETYQGAEPNVWIGLEEDINSDGTVNWGFPAYYRHSHSPKRIWGTVEWNTGNYYSGSHELFPRDFWGSDVFGNTAMPTTGAGCADVFNNVGNMFKKSFGFAKEIGVKTALGTELPMGVEPKGGEEVAKTWVRGMPLDLQDRLQNVYGKDLLAPQTTRDIYRGIFTRIQRMHDLDYFWLWTYEVWQNTGDVSNDQIQAIKDDIDIARQELNSLGNPFQLALAGWKIGSFPNTAEFDNPSASPYLPYDVPQYVLWDMCEGCEELSPNRVKWAATWTEEDWGLIQPQINVGRVYDDINAAVQKGAKGFIAKGWRNRAVAMNTHAMKYGFWSYGPTGSPVNTNFPSDYATWTDEVYMDWATRWFGAEVAQGLTNILSPMDKSGEPRQPQICEWDSDLEGANSAGSVILGQRNNMSQFSFVNDIAALEPLVVGEGNKERFSYLMKMFQSYYEKAEFGTDKEDWNRTNMIGHFNSFMTLDMERAVDVVDLGEIMHNNVMNWHQMVDLFGIDGNETPNQSYTGSAFVKVMPVRTQVEANEALTLNIISMPTTAPTPTVKYRELGGSTWTSITATNVGRQVFSATIPLQTQDFEYYVESGSEVFPVTATSASPIYQTVVVRAEEIDLCEGVTAGVPSNVTAIENDCNATITWDAGNCADNYRIQKSVNGGAWTTLDSAVSGTSYSDSLTNGESVQYRVRAQNAVGNSSDVNSNSLTANCPCQGSIPDVPTNVTASINACNVTITWDPATCADDYRVQLSLNGGSWTTLATVTSTSYSDDISNEASAQYRVRAQNGSLNSGDVVSNAVVGDCPPPPCTIVNSNDFESGWGIWNDGGTDARRSSNDAAYANGTYCIRLRDNTSTSVTTTDNLDLSAYTELNVSFSYLCRSMDNSNEDFWLQIDNGSGFNTVEEWNRDDEFVNDQRYNETVNIQGPFSSSSRLRFRCDASGDKDWVYIDDVEIEGCSGGTPTPIQYTFTVNATTGGTATGGGVFDEGSYVCGTANAETGYVFDSWTGDDANGCVTLNSNRTITANFIPESTGGAWDKIDDRDAGISYSGDWDNVSDGSAYAGTAKVGHKSSSEATYTFNGTQFRIYLFQWDASASGIVTITNSSVSNQTFSIGGVEDATSTLAYESPVLPSGSHTVTISRNGGEFMLDALEYYGSALKNSTNSDASFAASTPEVYIYPNPAVDNTVNIHILGMENEVNLRLVDLSGRVRIDKEVNIQNNEPINLSLEGLNKGIYILSIQSDGVNRNERLIVD